MTDEFDSKSDAYIAGYVSGWTNFWERCPYGPATDEYYEWQSGFRDANHDVPNEVIDMLEKSIDA